MGKKYKFTGEKMICCDMVLYRIQAVRDFGDVKCGDLGGWIQKEENLSHDGDCWVYDNAIVCENAKVVCDASVYHDAKVYGNAVVSGNAKVFNKAYIYGNTVICANAKVYDEAMVFGYAKVLCDAQCYHKSMVGGNAVISGYAKIGGDVIVSGHAEIGGDAKVMRNADYIVFKNWWSSLRHFTWTRSNNMWKVGCFHGTGNELINKAYLDSRDTGDEYKRVVRYVDDILKNKK